jgi:hypothetical protein
MPNSARTAPCKNTLAPFAQGETVEHTLPQQRANSHQIHRSPKSGIVPNRIIIVASSTLRISSDESIRATPQHRRAPRLAALYGADFPGMIDSPPPARALTGKRWSPPNRYEKGL